MREYAIAYSDVNGNDFGKNVPWIENNYNSKQECMKWVNKLTFGGWIANIMYIMLLTNNQRKMHGLPLWRKKNKRKRYYTRCEADETISAFLAYYNQ